jgi:hypothetical protein
MFAYLMDVVVVREGSQEVEYLEEVPADYIPTVLASMDKAPGAAIQYYLTLDFEYGLNFSVSMLPRQWQFSPCSLTLVSTIGCRKRRF